ncbi:MAG: DUF3592 domain-containing protein [Kiritimatiellae bacterium]|nr:DUF3592 domain-containing protein [Kiritimatiellia bacterium]
MSNQKEKKGLQLGRLIIGCVILALTAFFAWLLARNFLLPALSDYEPVPCRIIHSKVVQKRLDRFALSVSFSYKYKDRKYTSRSLCKPDENEFVFTRLAERRPLLEKYAPGKMQICRVNPKSPSDAVLRVEPVFKNDDGGMDVVKRGLPVIGLALLFGIGVFLIASAFPSVHGLVSSRFSKFSPALMVILFSLPFTLFGTIGAYSRLQGRGETNNYVPVSAKVLYSGLCSHQSRGRRRSTTYSVRVGYEYVVNGHTYESDRYSPVEISTSGYESHRRKAESYKVGNMITAYVSPTDPRKSVLVRSVALDEWFPIVAMGLFGIAGIGIMMSGIGMLFSALRQKEAIPSTFESYPLTCTHGELAGLGCFAIFWNFLTGGLLFGFYVGGIFQNFSPVFYSLAIFPIIGIVLVAVFFRGLVHELTSPKFTMTLSCAMWTPGAGAQIDWKLERADEVESLEIILEGARWTGGKHRRKIVVSTSSCYQQEGQLIPKIWRFGFSVPESLNDVKWAFIVMMKVKNKRRPYRLYFALPITS